MGIFRQIASAATGVPISSKRGKDTGSSDTAKPDDLGADPEFGDSFGTSALRDVVKRTGKRVGNKAGGR